MPFFDFLFNSEDKGKQRKNVKIGGVKAETLSKVTTDWANIKVLLKQKSPAQLKQALITADRCLDAVLKDTIEGDTMVERMKNMRNLLDRDSYNRMWESHKIRNNIVHEAGFDPPTFLVTESITDIENILIILGVRV